MTTLTLVKDTLAHLPSDLTGVVVGGTSGIGLYTLLAFARHCTNPTLYFVGRSQEAATRILSDLNKLNPKGTYHFIQSDVALIKNVDKVCEEIRAKEKYINVLVMSQGTLSMGKDTEEGVHQAASLILHSRNRFILNLLPLLQAAPTLRRVVSIFAGTKDGPMFSPNDLQGRHYRNPMKGRGQAASCVTLSLEEIARRAPDVGFVHSFPGPVRSNIGREFAWVLRVTMGGIMALVGPWIYVKEEDSGDRHLFLATAARYKAREGAANGAQVEGGEIAKGSDGEVGSGVYIVDQRCESGGDNVVQLLKGLRNEGWSEKVWEEIKGDYLRITGKESL